jgi:plastocyanin
VITLLAAMSAAACGSGSGYGGVSNPTTPTPPAALTVTATPALAFGPSNLAVTAGDTVTFAFQSVAHNVFFDAQAGAPANIEGSNANISVTRVFATPGAYHYTCHIHPNMQGTVTVQ